MLNHHARSFFKSFPVSRVKIGHAFMSTGHRHDVTVCLLLKDFLKQLKLPVSVFVT